MSIGSRQALRTKIFSTPFEVIPAKFVASEENAIGWPFAHPAVVRTLPHWLMLGFSLRPFAGVEPSGVEASRVVATQFAGATTTTPVQVSRTYTCWVGPSPGIRFMLVDAKATKRPSSEMDGSMLGAFDGVTPSGVETRLTTGAQVLPTAPIVVTQVELSNTWLMASGFDPVTRFVALDTNATKRPSFAIAGPELAPFPAAVPSGETETRNVVGVHPPNGTGGTLPQVFRTNT